MKLNCDLGEGTLGSELYESDALIMPLIDMANIACGFHASDPAIMARTVQLAKTHNVQIGAHPSYPDKEGFGRRKMSLAPDEITQTVLYQIGALQAICQAQGTQVDYVKPHGALYNTMMAEPEVFEAILQAVAWWNENSESDVPLMVLANAKAEALRQQAQAKGVILLFEAFSDRAYNDDGSLVSRDIDGAVLQTQEQIAAHVEELIKHQRVISIQGDSVSVHADSLCVHGDNPQAIAAVQSIRQLMNALLIKTV